MAFLDTNHNRAAFIIGLLGLALVVALLPFASGLFAIPVLYVVFDPLHRWLEKHVKARAAAALGILTALFVIVEPGVSFATLIVTQAQQMASGVVQSRILARLAQLHIPNTDPGPQLAVLGPTWVGWVGSSAFRLIC